MKIGSKVKIKGLLMFLWLIYYGSLSSAQIPVFTEHSTDIGIEPVDHIALDYGHGASAADYDMDGDIDFYLGTDTGIPNRLYRNNGNGTFEEIAQIVGLGLELSTRASLWFDYNGDHRLDIAMMSERCYNSDCEERIILNLFEQNSDGNFTKVTSDAGLSLANRFDGTSQIRAVGGMAAADLNNDNHLDLIITVWDGTVVLFQNNGNGTFKDVSIESSIGLTKKLYYQPMIWDVNQDGLMDVYINVDRWENELWINKGNMTFDNKANEYGGTSTNHDEMGMTLGDYDNDGDLDVYITNVNTGGTRRNALLKNDMINGVHLFIDMAAKLKTFSSGWDWGCTFSDFNNDGWVDLALTNGWNHPMWNIDDSRMWINNQAAFISASKESNLGDSYYASGLIAFDGDRDGDLDLLQTLQINPDTQSPAFYKKNSFRGLGHPDNYLVIKPRMKGNNHWSIGTIVRVKTGDLSQMRLITAGTSFYGQEPAEAFFGLGEYTSADQLRLEWPNQTVSIYENLNANQVLVIRDEALTIPQGFEVTFASGNFNFEWISSSETIDGFELHYSQQSDFKEYEKLTLSATDQNTLLSSLSSTQGSWFFRLRSFKGQLFSDYTHSFFINPLFVGNDDITVFPNPSSESTNLIINNAYKGKLTVTIKDFLGRDILSRNFIKSDLLFRYEILNELSSGIYLLKLEMGGLEFQTKMIRK